MKREHKLLSLLSQYEDLGIDKQIDYDKFYLYSLITHSTAIEGSTVTEIENQLLFDEGISAKGRTMLEQLMNLDLKNAYEESISQARQKTDISIETLKHLSSIVLKNTGATYNTALGEFSSTNGDLRLLNVAAGAGGRSYMNYSKVPIRLAELCSNVNKRRSELSKADIIECYKLSFDVHFQLVTIHPWADGNGRMCRLLMNQLQFEFGIIPSKINKNSKAEYIEALIATRESKDLTIFHSFMFAEHIRNLEQMIRNYQTSISSDDIVSHGDVGTNVGINVGINEHNVLDLIRANNRITAKEVAETLSLSLRQCERIIATLKEKELILRVGSNKAGHWELL